MSVVAEIGTAARALSARVDASIVSVGTDRRGSGVVIAAGKVATNAHNLRDRTTLVTFADGRAVQATLSGSDVDGDLVVLDVDTSDLPPILAAVADGAEPVLAPTPEMGDLVFAASRAVDGLRLTVGFVSGVERSFRGPRGRIIAGSIEHSAPLAPGSSGGPLFSADGALVGLNTHRIGRGFYLARPTDDGLLRRLTDLREGRSFVPPTLGIALSPSEVATRLRRAVGLAERAGLLVRQVEADSPAGRADLRSGDLLVRAAGRDLVALDDLHQALADLEPGQPMTLAVVRGAEELDVTVQFTVEPGGEDRPEQAEA